MNNKEYIKSLLSNGYKEFRPPSAINSATRAFQKRVRSISGATLYFITCYYYYIHINDSDTHNSFEFDLQFGKIHKDKEYTIDMKVFSAFTYNPDTQVRSFHPLNEVEELILEIYQNQQFETYD